MNCENDAGESYAVIWSGSCFSVDSIFNIVLIGFLVYRWSDFHWNIFPLVCSISSRSLVDCGILLDWILWHDAFGWLWFWVKLLLIVGFMNVFICFVTSINWSYFGMKLKYLVKFSFSSFHQNVSPHASSILYHLFGKSARVDGNICGHARSSLYPSFLHYFSHVFIWSSGF